jgi:hypothetical protein
MVLEGSVQAQAKNYLALMAGVIVSKMSGVIASSLGAGRAAPCRLLVPKLSQSPLDQPYARLGLFAFSMASTCSRLRL